MPQMMNGKLKLQITTKPANLCGKTLCDLPKSNLQFYHARKPATINVLLSLWENLPQA
jgi:hypothetical protein